MASLTDRLSWDSGRLQCNGQEVTLRTKGLTVLRYLLDHPGRVVDKETLLAACWPDVEVSPHALKVCIREIRAALRDDVAMPRFIETIPRQGYRFIGAVVSNQHSVVSSRSSHPIPNPQPPAPTLVGREAELAQLHEWLETAFTGQRQVVFVCGEPGIGKTTLVDAFLTQVATDGRFLVARGQCLEQYGAGEAYMPVLEALESLCRGRKGEQHVALLRRYAPTWLVQMPALLEPSSRGALQRELFGTTRERMLREATTVLEELTVRRGLILVLEDLHWSDHSTIELLAVLARRREPARLLVLGTYRPKEVTSRLHPLSGVKRELHMHEYCRELPLTRLIEAGVTQYLAACFPDVAFPPAVVHLVYERTYGNPLFLVNVCDHLIAQGVLVYQDGHWTLTCQAADVTIGLPARIQQLIEVQIARLGLQAQAILEAASIAGIDFSTAAVAAGLREEQEGMEKGCEELARHGQFLRAAGVEEWPDGTAATQYAFLHALYQEAFYERVAAGRRIHVHQRIGTRLETGYGERAGEIATALAMHFERGRDFSRAVKYY